MQSNPALVQPLRRAALTGVVGSGLLAVVKVVAGVIGHSHAVIADGVESGGDTVAGVVVLLGLAESERPPDAEHPYGHSRAEDVAGKTVSTMMLVSGFMLLWTNVAGLYDELFRGLAPQSPHAWTLPIILVSLAVKCGLFVYKLNVGRRLRSTALVVDAWNDFTDVIAAVAVVLGLILARLGYLWADRSGAIVVSLLIMYTAIVVSKAASDALLDQQAPPEVLQELRETALSVPGVKGVEKLLARRSGLMYFVEMHLEVDPAMPVRDAHALGHAVKARLQQQRKDVADVLIHLEPAK
ncbi:MAG TPA: cation diffusion facilitator family transporter [Planctomycetota bacterium]|nr:cation diffusion facilitator family transporter [Planctomycetota bacterium]